MILITGTHKSFALYKAIEEGVNHMWTVSAFQQHEHTLMICDEDATLELRVKTVKYFKVSFHGTTAILMVFSPSFLDPYFLVFFLRYHNFANYTWYLTFSVACCFNLGGVSLLRHWVQFTRNWLGKSRWILSSRKSRWYNIWCITNCFTISLN